MEPWKLIIASTLVVIGQANYCERLRFRDPVLGFLVPCEWEKASGMLCVRRAPDVFVWPTERQSVVLRDCGFYLRNFTDSTPSTTESSQSAETETPGSSQSAEEFDSSQSEELGRAKRETANAFDLAKTEKRRKKRFYEEENSVDSETHRATNYNFKKILSQFVRDEWSSMPFMAVDPSIKLWVEREAKLRTNDEKGIYRVMGGPSDEFNPTNTDRYSAASIMKLESRKIRLSLKKAEDFRRLLKRQRILEGWRWLDVERIMLEFELCYKSDYSTVTETEHRFDSPRGFYERRNNSAGDATFKMWYYRMSCMKTRGRIFATVVIYTEQLGFADVARTVRYWRNNPRTEVKWLNATKQRIENFVRSELAYKFSRHTGAHCTKSSSDFPGGISPINGAMQGAQLGGLAGGYGAVIGGVIGFAAGLFGFGKKETLHCSPFDIKKNESVVMDLADFKVVTDVEPIQFKYEVNQWALDTKKVFSKRKLTLKQREGLKDWLNNAMLLEIGNNFKQFFID